MSIRPSRLGFVDVDQAFIPASHLRLQIQLPTELRAPMPKEVPQFVQRQGALKFTLNDSYLASG